MFTRSSLIALVARVVAVAVFILVTRPSLGWAAVFAGAALAAAVVGPRLMIQGWRRYRAIRALCAIQSDTVPARASEFEQAYRALRSGATDEAVAGFAQAAASAPQDADAHFYLGVALLESGRPADAIAPLREAVSLRPLHAEAHAKLGMALEGAGDRWGAMLALREAVRLDPRLKGAAALLGQLSASAA